MSKELKFSEIFSFIPVFIPLWLDKLCVLAWLHQLLHKPLHLRCEVPRIQACYQGHHEVGVLWDTPAQHNKVDNNYTQHSPQGRQLQC